MPKRTQPELSDVTPIEEVNPYYFQPCAKSITFLSSQTNVYIIALSNNTKFIIPASNIQGLEKATFAQLHNVTLIDDGLTIAWSDLDVYLPVNLAIQGVFGDSGWMEDLQIELARVKFPVIKMDDYR